MNRLVGTLTRASFAGVIKHRTRGWPALDHPPGLPLIGTPPPHLRLTNPKSATLTSRTIIVRMMSTIVEDAKRLAAYRAVDGHFPRPDLAPETPSTTPLIIGIGSGSTIVYVVERILQLPAPLLSQCIFVPTGYQSRHLILSGGLTLGEIDTYNDLLIAFDGADEIDPALNCIKGGGACLLQEKLVAVKARKFVAVADYRKLSSSLSTCYLPGIPIEVVPPAVSYVTNKLIALGSVNPTLRMGGAAKAGPCVTDNSNFIIDAPFPNGVMGLTQGIVTGGGVGPNEAVEALAKSIKSIVGVVEHGIFWAGDRKPIVAYFGMQNGEVTTRPLNWVI
ncbi:ribose 5-phosphate isomerase A-domain-containing protein [Kalaharituber pfeilii]|nr:ribose 5-phosphate isomerase A-domain-containing protein [Kalaharituber pfeilii]